MSTNQDSQINVYSYGTNKVIDSLRTFTMVYNYTPKENEEGNDITNIGSVRLMTKKVDGALKVRVAQPDLFSNSERYAIVEKNVNEITSDDVILFQFKCENKFYSRNDHAGIAHDREFDATVYSVYGIYGKQTKNGNIATKFAWFSPVWVESASAIMLEKSPVAVGTDSRTRTIINDAKLPASLQADVKAFHVDFNTYFGYGTAKEYLPIHHDKRIKEQSMEMFKKALPEVVVSTVTNTKGNTRKRSTRKGKNQQ